MNQNLLTQLIAWLRNLRERFGGRLTAEEAAVLAHLWCGGALRSHRDLDGRKVYRLTQSDGATRPVVRAVVLALRERRFLETNHKFPTATYLLTERGRSAAIALVGDVNGVGEADGAGHPLTARDFVRD